MKREVDYLNGLWETLMSACLPSVPSSQTCTQDLHLWKLTDSLITGEKWVLFNDIYNFKWEDEKIPLTCALFSFFIPCPKLSAALRVNKRCQAQGQKSCVRILNGGHTLRSLRAITPELDTMPVSGLPLCENKRINKQKYFIQVIFFIHFLVFVVDPSPHYSDSNQF
jgi:hypothetical protein